jgi:hypothetical protein
MKRTLTVALVVLIFALCGRWLVRAQTDPSKDGHGQGDQDLADAVIACTFVVPYVEDTRALEKSRCVDLVKNISDTGAWASGFSHLSYRVQISIPGNTYGFVRQRGKTLKQSGVPSTGLLFATDPVPSLAGGIVVILSAVSPERTVILALDRQMHSRLIYDSFQPLSGGQTPLGGIYQVKVLGDAKLLLRERRVPGEDTSVVTNRTFVLDTKQGMTLTQHRNTND